MTFLQIKMCKTRDGNTEWKDEGSIKTGGGGRSLQQSLVISVDSLGEVKLSQLAKPECDYDSVFCVG